MEADRKKGGAGKQVWVIEVRLLALHFSIQQVFLAAVAN